MTPATHSLQIFMLDKGLLSQYKKQFSNDDLIFFQGKATGIVWKSNAGCVTFGNNICKQVW